MSISHDVNKGNIHVWHAYLSFYVGKLESTDCHQFLLRNLRGKLHFLYLCIYALTTLFFFYTKSNLRRSKTQEAPCLNINITSYKQMRKITVPAYVWNKHLYIQLVNIYHYLHLILVFFGLKSECINAAEGQNIFFAMSFTDRSCSIQELVCFL